MSNKVGKISSIKKDYNPSATASMQNSLAAKGYTRVPGTGVFKSPYKELDGKYRTGLDPDAAYIKRIQDPAEKQAEINKVTLLKEKLEGALGVDLGPRSPFWNYALASTTDDPTHVQHVKLLDADNFYDLDIPIQELTFAWLRVHPTIASSYQAWQRGDYPSDTQFYVVDEEVETERTYRKKSLVNKAVRKLEDMTPEKRRKAARLMGLPVSEDSKDQYVYNLIDGLLKQSEFTDGKFKGQSTIALFDQIVGLKESIFHKKDLVEQAITLSVYREKQSGAIYEGELEVAKSKDELITKLEDDNNQDSLLALEQKVKTKKLV